MKYRFIAVLLGLCVLWLLPQPLVANSEYIEEFDTRVHLAADNRAEIVERITYNFGDSNRHGIFRDIPIRYFTDENRGFELDLEVEAVKREGNSEPYEVNEQGDGMRTRIGNPDRTIRGVHTYEIRYILEPVVRRASGEDIFRLDATGLNWEVPIRSASLRFTSEVPITDTDCYAGEFGSGSGACRVDSGPQQAIFQTEEQLAPGEGMTIEAAYEPGSFERYPKVRAMEPSRSDRDWGAVGVWVSLGVVILAFLGGFGIPYIRYRWRRSNQTVIPRYEPPAGMKPAEAGLLIDHTSDTTEFTATLIDLAVRGYINIEQYKKRSWLLFRQSAYRLHQQKPFEDVEPYERELLEVLFEGKDTVDLESVDGENVGEVFRDIHQTLIARLEDQGYYREKTPWLKTIKLYKSEKIGAGSVVILIVYAIANGWIGLLFSLVLLPLAIATWAGSGLLFSRQTRQGLEAWADVAGFKDFLMLTHKERLSFHNAPQRDPDQFHELLPYAVALGVEKQWAKQFKDLNMDSLHSWYHGSDSSNTASSMMVSRLSSGLGSYAESNFISSSSAGSGGSFSGGGVGGGGGGSW